MKGVCLPGIGFSIANLLSMPSTYSFILERALFNYSSLMADLDSIEQLASWREFSSRSSKIAEVTVLERRL